MNWAIMTSFDDLHLC